MKFHSNPIEEHPEAPLADEGRWERLVARGAKLNPALSSTKHDQNACYVVSVGAWQGLTPDDVEIAQRAQLKEILGLVHAQGDRIVGCETYRLRDPDPRTFLGSGTAEAIAARATAAGADLLVLDAELSPSQTRNLEDATGFSICDREAVILNVFSLHANTRKARIQVEIAHLEYLRPRIRGIGLNMDQQAGGLARARGPGETASELLARRLDGRLAELRKQNARLERAGDTQRKNRDACLRIALVGYTNAGKTSLMNGLTAAELSAKDVPFETLDTTSRSLTRHGGDVVISDTVGFIRRLPARLLASFETTLAEIREASLLAVVVDLSDPEWDMHIETTETVITKLGAGELPRFYVFNKADQVAALPTDQELRARCRGGAFAALSSRDRDALAGLKQALIRAARHDYRTARVLFPYRAKRAIASAYATSRVIAAEATEDGLELTIEAAAHVVERIVLAGKVARS